MTRKTHLLIVLAVAVVVVVGWLAWPKSVAKNELPPAEPSALPRIEDIAKIEWSSDSTGFKQEIPAKFWTPILSALAQGSRATKPAKIKSFNELKIVQKDGSVFLVQLFDPTEAKEVEFSAGKSKDNLVYYRGGRSGDLWRPLDDAMSAMAEGGGAK